MRFPMFLSLFASFAACFTGLIAAPPKKVPKPSSEWVAKTHGLVQLAFSPDGKVLATGSSDNAVKVWDPQAGKLLRTLQAASGQIVKQGEVGAQVWAIVFSPDGSTIATAGTDKVVRLWDWKAGKESATLKGHDSPVTALAFSADGQTLASGSFEANGTSRLWDLKAKKTRLVLKKAVDIRGLAFAPDSKTLASIDIDNEVAIWDSQSGQQLTSMKAPVSDGGGRVMFSCDGKTLLTTSSSHVVLRQSHNLQPTRTLDPHDITNGACLSPDGKLLASWGAIRDDPGHSWGEFALWDPASGKLLIRMDHDGAVEAGVFSPDGKKLAVSDKNGTIEMWDVATLLKSQGYGVQRLRRGGRRRDK